MTVHLITQVCKKSSSGKKLECQIKLKQLKLNEKEEKSFEKFFDPITLNIMHIPILLNGNRYDLQTLTNAGIKKTT